MQTIAARLDQAFRRAIRQAFNVDADPLIALAQNPAFGDYQANAAMGLAKQLAQSTGQKTNPRAVAEQIKQKLELGEMVQEVTIAGPGFINVRLAPAWLWGQLQGISADTRLGLEPAADPQIVLIDYSGPNVAKQMHIGHLRSTNIGDALSRILEFQGQEMIRQNHMGDWGTQFGMLLAYLKKRQGDAASHIEDLDEFYRSARQVFDTDPAFADESRQTVVRLQAGEAEELRLWQRIVQESRAHFQPLYERMNVRLSQADERGESFYNDLLADTVRELKEKGVAVESEGAVVIFIQGYEAPLIIQKRDGGFGYATTDLAALRYRIRELGAKRIIYVTDARQSQHFAQVFSAARQAGWTEGVILEHAQFGSILGADGKPMKTRQGETVKLKAVLDEAENRAFELVSEKSTGLDESARRAVARAVGIGAVKYFDLNKDRAGDYIFDWQKMLAMDGNTAPYLQYAYARIQSIFRKAGDRPAGAADAAKAGPAADATLTALATPQELSLAKHLLRLGEVLELVARELKPHHLCNYLYELSARFSGFYEHCPVLQSEEPTRTHRLALCRLTAEALGLGLDLLGIEHPTQM
jgi:arginyl-tRNA synthetase